ncbi:MAG: hypothetical protein IPN01_32515 [Deltaproteobacteria bacterium]|nr:hypothetical protein [Deltaproteobacteria bacterium]
MPTDPQAMSLDLYAQLLQARDRLDDLLPIAERACTNAETLALTTLQGADADPRPLMLDLTHLQSHLDGLTSTSPAPQTSKRPSASSRRPSRRTPRRAP